MFDRFLNTLLFVYLSILFKVWMGMTFLLCTQGLINLKSLVLLASMCIFLEVLLKFLNFLKKVLRNFVNSS